MSKGGNLISTKYQNNREKLEWECEHGHRWLANANTIRSGGWCPVCSRSRQRLGLDLMREIAKGFGGECLSNEYLGVKSKLKWKCTRGHVWEAAPYWVRQGNWCPFCSRKIPRITLADMQRIAEERGGKCLESSYKNDSTSMKWECRLGHRWYATANNIRNGKWCPICSSGRMERICRIIFESAFDAKFPSAQPKWLTNAEGNFMQLDGYNQKIGIAFEYQGVQHYQVSRYTPTKKALQKRIRDDELKRNLCEKKGITLIQIPSRKAEKGIIKFLEKVFHTHRIDVEIPSLDDIDFSSAYSPNPIEQCQEMAEKRGGKCLSKNYISARTPVLWECKKGHTWESAPTNIQSGTWCPKCAGVDRVTREDAIQLAASRNGKFLSTAFNTASDKYRWCCSKGHKWLATYSSIKCGSWCPTCSRKKYLNIGIMKTLAEERGGQCLSRKYMNSKTKLRFKCVEGHVFQSTSDKVIQGRWCPECANLRRGASQRLSIEEMQQIASERGGRCLSEVYVNVRTKLRWECFQGHVWEAVPYTVKKGSWCPVCAKMKRKAKIGIA
ncbi:MAG: hypothetical protein KAU38_09880 [Desulfobacterales bacterium]|nr:hypothetical protein [Desulfobacterales bacterium]